MAIPSQIMELPFAAGLDTKSDEILVQPGKLVELENGVFTKGGTIQPRNGYTGLSNEVLGGTALSASSGLAAYEKELLQFSGSRLYTRSAAVDKWIDKSDLSPLSVSHNPVIRNGYTQTRGDMAIAGGFEVFIWEDSRGSVRATVRDVETGAEIQTDVELRATADRPKVIAVEGKAVCLYHDSGALYTRVFDPLDPSSFTAETSVISDVSATDPYYDAAASNKSVVIAYQNTGAFVTLTYVDDDGGAGVAPDFPNPEVTTIDGSESVSVIVEPVNFNVYVSGHNTTSGLEYAKYDINFTLVFAPVVVDSAVVAVDQIAMLLNGTSVEFYYEVTAASAYNHFVKSAVANTTGTVTTAASDFKKGVGLAHKLFAVDGTTYVGLSQETDLQQTYFLAKSNGFVVGRHLASLGGGVDKGFLPEVISGGNEIHWASEFKSRFVTEVNEDDANTIFTLTGIGRTTYDFASSRSHQTEQIGKAMHITGGVPSLYDGSGVFEVGFNSFPEGIVPTEVNLGAGGVANGTYSLVAVYAWFDAQGQLHRSAPSPAVQLVVGSGPSDIDVTVPTLRITNKENVFVELYSTETTGTVFYKVTDFATPVFNDKTVDTVTVSRTQSDATIISGEVLYTQGGIVENIPPPPSADVVSIKNRLFLADAEDGNRVWYSKFYRQDQGVAFSDLFTIRVDPQGGSITALAGLDDKLIIYKRDEIFVCTGDGPQDTGFGGQFSIPQVVATDVGCVDPRTIINGPQGVAFQSAKGFYILDRSLRVSYIGAPVEGFNGQTYTSAVLLDDVNEMRWTTNSGLTVVWNYFFNQWATFTNHEGEGAVVSEGVYYYARTNGEVYQEDATAIRDNGATFKLELVTAWIKAAGLQGYKRVRRFNLIGNFLGTHKLRVQVGYDYQPFYRDTYSFDPSEVLVAAKFGETSPFGGDSVFGGVEDDVYQTGTKRLTQQKCESIRFRISDTDIQGKSYSIAGLAMDVAPKRGLFKLKTAKAATTG